MKKLKEKMSNSKDLPKISLVSSVYKLYSDRLQACLTHSYMSTLPLRDQMRALRELKIVQSIRRKLIKYKLVLRETDKSGVLHIGRAIDYQRKAAEYRQKTGAYEELLKLVPVREKTELAYIPILNTIRAATTLISKFLDRSIRPLFDRFIRPERDRFVRQTTIIDGADLLHQLQSYIEKGYFNSSTLFITCDINNLYTMLPQEESLKVLEEFLREHQCERINGISVDTIIELARVVLQANAFVCDNKFYRQIIGGAMGSAFTLTLANIFMWKWEKETILKKLPSHEIYGRSV
jgi:hypothetical protein